MVVEEYSGGLGNVFPLPPGTLVKYYYQFADFHTNGIVGLDGMFPALASSFSNEFSTEGLIADDPSDLSYTILVPGYIGGGSASDQVWRDWTYIAARARLGNVNHANFIGMLLHTDTTLTNNQDIISSGLVDFDYNSTIPGSGSTGDTTDGGTTDGGTTDGGDPDPCDACMSACEIEVCGEGRGSCTDSEDKCPDQCAPDCS